MFRFLICFAAALSAVSMTAADDGFESLFNGKDLSGWKGDSDLWRVEDGCITGQTRGPDHLPYNKFLIWEGSAADFELRCEFRLEGKNNSGVQYRSVHDTERGEFVCAGYQADIHANPEYTGMLYEEKGRGILARRGQKVVILPDGKKKVTPLDGEVKPIDLTKWHELTITARGNHLVHKIDGEVTVDVTDRQKDKARKEGVIALQVHRGPAMKVQFRNIRLRHLKKKQKRADAQTSRTRPEDAVPRWIWQQQNGQPAKTVFFRKEFDSSGVAAARLYGACDDRMKIYLDGRLLISHDTPATPVFVDLSEHIDLDAPQTTHVLAVEAENTSGTAGVLIRLDLESGWRDSWSIVSDDSWLVSTEPQDGWKQQGFVPDASRWGKPDLIAALGEEPWADAINQRTLAAVAPLKPPTATPAEQLKIKKGFQVELLYSVPKETQGSWVNMCVDPIGRLIVSDQYGSLYRVTVPGIAGAKELRVEPIPVDIGEAQGLLWAFDSLYVSVNKGQKYDGGLYRVTDSDNDDQLDTVKVLRKLRGTGEHGPHAVLKHPDGKSLVLVCGNRTELTDIKASRLPTWDEDLLLPRVQGKFMRGTRAPGGCIYKLDPDGKEFELLAAGFRNQFDAAFNRANELFTYDADMEWDLNTPWYRPTRICHVVSGAEFGWRSGGGKWPVYYEDSVPPVVNIGPGSPTGVCFGYGALFPQPWESALFACDWSYGKMYAVHIPADGSSEGTRVEEFISGTPLPLTDVVINPFDGAMYFTIGGRRVQSGLYKVTHSSDMKFTAERRAELQQALEAHQRRFGDKSAAGDTLPADDSPLKDGPAEVTTGRLEELDGPSAVSGTSASLQIRKRLEARHHPGNHADAVWEYLGHKDRKVRYAARIALEHSPLESFYDRALGESNTQAQLMALMAVARKYERRNKGEEPDIDSPIPDWDSVLYDEERSPVTTAILNAVSLMNVNDMTEQQKLTLLRVMTLTFVRVAPPNPEEREAIMQRLEFAFPAETQPLNSEIAQMMVYLQAPYAAEKLVAALEAAPTQEEQIDFARTLRHLTVGWTPELQEKYFKWFIRAATYEGGASFQLFVTNIKNDAIKNLSEQDRQRLKPILEAKPASTEPDFSSKPRPVVKEWTMEDLLPLVETGLKGRDFDRGRRLFGEARCFACHRFDNRGGAVGPDLTALSGRFSPRDLLEAILDPDKQISDQYAAVQIVTTEGKVITGRIVNLAGDSIRVQTDMLRPGKLTSIDRKQVEEIVESKVSMMPKGLLNGFHEDEILDLLAYLLSRGDRNHPMFKK